MIAAARRPSARCCNRDRLACRFPVLFLLLALVVASAASCSSAPVAREGTIVYYDPRPARGGFRQERGGRQPLTLTITTETEINKDETKGDLVVVKGALDPRVGDRLGERRVATEVLGALSDRNRNRVVTPEEFGEIWSGLVKAGLLDLPTLPGGRPPTDVPRIELRSGDRSWVFLRPKSFHTAASGDAESIREANTWQRTVVLIQTSYSSRAAHFEMRD